MNGAHQMTDPQHSGHEEPGRPASGPVRGVPATAADVLAVFHDEVTGPDARAVLASYFAPGAEPRYDTPQAQAEAVAAPGARSSARGPGRQETAGEAGYRGRARRGTPGPWTRNLSSNPAALSTRPNRSSRDAAARTRQARAPFSPRAVPAARSRECHEAASHRPVAGIWSPLRPQPGHMAWPATHHRRGGRC